MRTSLHLSLEQLVAVENVLAHGQQPSARRRAEAIRLLHLGLTPAQIAVRFGCSPKTIRAWRLRYLDAGIEGLYDRPRTGRRSRADQRYIEAMEALLAQHPRGLGYGDCHGFTAQRLSHRLELETGIALSAKRLRVVLHRLGYQYRPYNLPIPKLVPLPGSGGAIKAYMAYIESLPRYMSQFAYTWVKKKAPAAP